MSDDLEILWQAYAEEKLQLEKIIEQYIAEGDYELAYVNSNSLHLIRRKLEVLNRLKDPDYDKKERLKREQRFYQKICAENANKFDVTIWQEKLNEVKKQEEQMNKKGIVGTIPGQELDDAFFDLAEGIIESFKFYLRKEQNLFIRCELATALKLQLSLTFAPEEAANNYVFEQQKKSLIGLGFDYNQQKESFVYHYDFERFKSAGFLKTLFARIVFDVFAFSVDNPTTIVYSAKKSS